MAKKKTEKKKQEQSGIVAHVQEIEVQRVLEENYMPYAMSVIVSRALPEIDGLKPSHRKIMYTMYKMGLLKGAKTKSANIVGNNMRLSPHGDGAIYGTMVRLARGNESLLHPYIDSKGNFGKVYSRDMAFAASRYTEAKLETIAGEFFKGIEKGVVNFIDNYDSTTTEPELLPVNFPSILANPNMGIAVGMSSNICSFNLAEICQVTIDIIESTIGRKPKITIDDLIKNLKAPDFPTGGVLIYNEDTMRNIYETGRGTFKLRAVYNYDKKSNCVEITEIPYTTTIEAIVDSITDMARAKTLNDITDVRDETDKDGLKIVIDLKKGVDADQLMDKLYLKTPLESSYSCNFNMIIRGNPVTLGVREILDEWIDFRESCVKRQITYDIERNKNRLSMYRAIEQVLIDLDKAIKIVRGTETDKDVIPNLCKHFKIDEEQATYVAEIKLRNFNKEYLLNRIKDMDKIEKDIKSLESTLSSDTKIKRIIIKDLEQIIKDYGKERLTRVVSEKKAIIENPTELLVEDYNLKMYLTSEGYLKKVPLVSLRGNSEHKLKENDYVVQEIDTTNKSDLLLFSNKQTVYKLKIHEIEDTKLSSWGDYTPNLLSLDKDEEIVYIVCTENYEGSVVYFFNNGKTAKIDMKGYETKTNRKQLVKAFSNKAELVRMFYLGNEEEMEVILRSDVDKILVVDTSNISINTYKQSGGLNTMKLKKGEKVNKVYLKDEIQFTDIDYYATKNIPAVGKFLKAEDTIL